MRYRESARALAATFRVAYLVSGAVRGRAAAHLGQALRQDSWRWSCRADLADLGGPRLESRLRQFATLGGLASEIRIEG